MSFERDDSVGRDNERLVTLSGKELSILPLRFREIIEIAGLSAKLASNMPFDAEKMNACIDVIRVGARRAHPKITRDDLLDLPASMPDLMKAALVVVEQSGGGQKPAAGEQVATSDSTNSTGTSSSPASA